jgi:outer membrane protein OmpA-like peptidoglycan-associated protein
MVRVIAAAVLAAATEVGIAGNAARAAEGSGGTIVGAQAPRSVDSNTILRSLAPIDYLPEHAGKKRAIDLDVRFEVDSAKPTKSAMAQLDALAVAMKGARLGRVRFQIAGHTDASGASSYNKMLSLNRALAVKAYLVQRHGIRAARLETVGWGEERLKNPINPEGAENRRVEVTVLSAHRKRIRPLNQPDGGAEKMVW